MFSKRCILSAFFLFICSFLPKAQQQIKTKKLIEFGWDYPTVSDLKTNSSKIESLPFQGVCFSIDKNIYDAFDNTLYPDSKFQFDNLTGIKWQKLTDNFLIVRGTSTSGAHWLDDKSWDIISRNLKKISKAVSLTGSVGIGFDPEYYYKDSTLNPWIYKPEYYNNLSYEQVGEYVRKRGKQFIEALQANKANIKILCFWLLGWVWDQHATRPIEKTTMALYPFFIEGMLEGQNNSSEIIDGNESSYWYQSFVPFVTVGHNIRRMESGLIKKDLRDKFQKISVSQSVFLDGLYAMSPAFNKGFDNTTKPRWLRDNLYFAFKTSDEYVWLYDERVNWWKNSVDPEIVSIINEVKDKVHAEAINDSSMVQGQSSIPNFKKEWPNTYQGFFYKYDRKRNRVKIKLNNSPITNFQVYENSHLIFSTDKPEQNFAIDLKYIYTKKGNLILVSKDSKGNFSIAFVN